MAKPRFTVALQKRELAANAPIHVIFSLIDGGRTTTWETTTKASAEKWFKILDEIVSELSEALPPTRPRSRWLDVSENHAPMTLAEAASRGLDHFSDETGDYNIISTEPQQTEAESMAALAAKVTSLSGKWYEKADEGFGSNLPFHDIGGTGEPQ